jgi:antitoxin component of MazEF toxin-antitoxin module
MVKIQELKHGGQLIITVPRAIAQAKGFKKGMELEYVIDNLGQLILRPKQV